MTGIVSDIYRLYLVRNFDTVALITAIRQIAVNDDTALFYVGVIVFFFVFDILQYITGLTP